MAPRPKPTRPRYVFARATTSVREPGSKYPTTIHQGTVWHPESPMVLAHPDLFSEEPPEVLPRGWSPPVEQATAAPGEVRDAGR
jgi:hypothetical protein